MSKKNVFAQFAAGVALLAMLVPNGSLSAETVKTANAVVMTDVALEQGVLTGQFLTNSGQGVTDTSVSIEQAGKVVAQSKTTAEGQFAVVGLKNGVYELKTLDRCMTIRTWDSAIAPPTASATLTLIKGDAVRGQECDVFCDSNGGRKMLSKSTLLPVVLVAAAVTGITLGIIAIDNHNDRHNSP